MLLLGCTVELRLVEFELVVLTLERVVLALMVLRLPELFLFKVLELFLFKVALLFLFTVVRFVFVFKLPRLPVA